MRLLLLCLLLSACVTTNVVPYRTLPPKASVEEVEVITERKPSREFEEVGLIEVDGAYGWTYAELVQKARQEGAKLGADAIIVSRDPIEGPTRATGRTIGNVSQVSAKRTDIPRLWVLAIIWKGQPAAATSTP